MLDSADLKVLACSSFYKSEPVGYLPQPYFINTVVKLKTELSPLDLLSKLKIIEKTLGKDIKKRWGPRSIDLDILLYDNNIINTPDLQIPHPRIAERSFVLMPLTEIAAECKHPLLGQNMRDLLRKLDNTSKCVKLEGNCHSERSEAE